MHNNEIYRTWRISFKVLNVLHCLHRQPLGALQSQQRKWRRQYRKLITFCGFTKTNQLWECRNGFKEILGLVNLPDRPLILGASSLHRANVSAKARIQGAPPVSEATVDRGRQAFECSPRKSGGNSPFLSRQCVKQSVCVWSVPPPPPSWLYSSWRTLAASHILFKIPLCEVS
jgi:hypothetical protein